MLPPLFAIFSWPALGAIFFGNLRLPLAILVTIIGGFLLLPEITSLDLPLLPALDKNTIPALTALALSALFASRPDAGSPLPGLWSRLAVGRILFLGLLLGAFATVLTNGDPLIYGPRYMAGLRVYDFFSTVLTLLMLLLPLLLARKHLASPEMHRLLLVVLCISALAYSLLALLEIRLSPQMNRWVYGFFPHSWNQHVRGSGYRPLVFLSHGLVLAMFFCMAGIAAFGLSRADPGRRGKYLLAALWLLTTLALSRSLGALVIALAMLPVVMFLSIRTQLMVASAVAVIFLTYPVLRGSQLVPLDTILNAADDIDPVRAGSLEYRFDHEEMLLEKARERPVFGWGSWGRWRVFNERGQDITVSDGYWVIVIGSGGWARYLFEFGLLAMPIFLLLWRSRREGIDRETATLALILAANLVDLLPNASLTPITWLVAGALWGRLEFVPETAAEAGQGAPATASRPLRPDHARPRPGAEMPVSARPASVYTRQTDRIVRPGPLARR